MACHIAYEVEDEAATVFFFFFESICEDSPFKFNNSNTSSVSDTGHWAKIISSNGTDDEDDEEVVFPLVWYGM